MFCKWCGATLDISNTKCKRCGKDVPALSDCGGFYDLVPNVKKIVEVQSVPVEVQSAPAVMPKRKKNIKRMLVGLVTLTVALVLAIALLILVIALGKKSQAATETEVVSDPVIEETHVISNIAIQVDESEIFVIDEVVDLSNKSATSKLQYRFDETSDWKDIPDDEFEQIVNAEKFELIIDETWLQEVMNDNPEGKQFELRCEITYINPDGSSVTVTVEGIKKHEE